MINLGDRVKNTVTGFTGIAVTELRHLTGCTRWIVQGETLDKGIPTEPQVFDENTLILVKNNAVKLPKASVDPGGPLRLPKEALR